MLCNVRIQQNWRHIVVIFSPPHYTHESCYVWSFIDIVVQYSKSMISGLIVKILTQESIFYSLQTVAQQEIVKLCAMLVENKPINIYFLIQYKIYL